MQVKLIRVHGTGRQGPTQVLENPKRKQPRKYGDGRSLNGQVCANCKKGWHGSCFSKTCGCCGR